MLFAIPPFGPPLGPAAALDPSSGADDNGADLNGFETLLLGLLVPSAPPAGASPPLGPAAAPGTAPAGALSALGPAVVPEAAPSADAAAGDAALPGDTDRPLPEENAGPLLPPGQRAVAAATTPVAAPPEPAPDARVAEPVARLDAAPSNPSPSTPIRDVVPTSPPSSRELLPPEPAPVERAAPAGTTDTRSVELLAGRPDIGHATPRATVEPPAARPHIRADGALAARGPARGEGIENHFALDDGPAWGGPIALGGSTAVTGASSDAAAPPDAPLGAAAVRQLALAIGRAVTGDVRQLSIQLRPEELGNLEITVDFADEHRVAVTIRAERPETLDLLRGETRQLERLMAQQGVSLAAGGFELGLMADGQGHRREHAGTNTRQRPTVGLRGRDDAPGSTPPAAPPARPGLLNLSV